MRSRRFVHQSAIRRFAALRLDVVRTFYDKLISVIGPSLGTLWALFYTPRARRGREMARVVCAHVHRGAFDGYLSARARSLRGSAQVLFVAVLL